MKRTVHLIPILVALAYVGNTSAAEPPISALAFSPDESQILTGSQAGVRCYSWPDLKPGRAIKTELKQVHDLAFSPDGKTLAIAGGTPGEEGTVELWNWPKADRPRSYSLHSDVIYQVVWSRDSQSLWTAGHDTLVTQMAAQTGMAIREFAGHSQPVTSICLIANKKVLISAGSDQTIRVWDAGEGKLLRSFNNHTGAVVKVAVRPTGDEAALPMIASIARDKTLRLWQPTIGRMVRFKRFPNEPLALAWSPDGSSLFLTEAEGNLIQVDPDTLESVKTLKMEVERPASLFVTKDGKTAVVGGSRGVFRLVRLD